MCVENLNYLDHWVDIPTADEIFGITNPKFIRSTAHYHKYPPCWFKDGMVNIGYIYALRNYKIRLLNAAHEYYYWLLEEGGVSLTDIVNSIIALEKEEVNFHTFYQYLRRDLWQEHKYGFNVSPPSKYLVMFVKFAEAAIPIIARELNKV